MQKCGWVIVYRLEIPDVLMFFRLLVFVANLPSVAQALSIKNTRREFTLSPVKSRIDSWSHKTAFQSIIICLERLQCYLLCLFWLRLTPYTPRLALLDVCMPAVLSTENTK